jgi:hypothetical protein
MINGEDRRRTAHDPSLNYIGLPVLDLLTAAEPSAPTMIRARLTTWLRELGWPPDDITGSTLAVNEAVTGFITQSDRQPADEIAHARVQMVGVIAVATIPRPGVGIVQFVVRDWHRWRPGPTPPVSSSSMGVMQALMQDVIVDATIKGTSVTLITPPVAVLDMH